MIAAKNVRKTSLFKKTIGAALFDEDSLGANKVWIKITD